MQMEGLVAKDLLLGRILERDRDWYIKFTPLFDEE